MDKDKSASQVMAEIVTYSNDLLAREIIALKSPGDFYRYCSIRVHHLQDAGMEYAQINDEGLRFIQFAMMVWNQSHPQWATNIEDVEAALRGMWHSDLKMMMTER